MVYGTIRQMKTILISWHKDWTKQSELFKSEPTDMLFYLMGDTKSLSNDKANDLNLVLSPNPNNGNFNISGISNTSSPINIEVIDLHGRTILSIRILNY